MIKAFFAKARKQLRSFWPKKAQPEAAPASEPTQQEQPQAQPAEQRRPPRRRRPERPQTPPQPAWTLAEFPVAPVEGRSRFHDFGLPLELMRGIAELEFKYCTPIQEQALPAALAGQDIIGKAGTGTGKSAVFLIALFTRLLKDRQAPRKPGLPRALIIAPTRELVAQIAKDSKALGKYLPLRAAAVFGGAEYQKQAQLLRSQPVDVIAATPGRLLDYVSQGVISLAQVEIMVIDEADRMLDMGFIPDVRRIISRLPPKEQRQTLLFSATVNADVKHLAAQWCVKPVSIESDPEQVAVETVRQLIYTVTSEEKYTVLYNLLAGQGASRVMVFANMKHEAARLHERLRCNGLETVLLSGDVPQEKRMARLERFRDGKVKAMIATDVAGRGIHIDGISHVVNYSLPYEPEDYVHRIGRTGRAGESGTAVSFACEEGAFQLPAIEEYIGRKLACVMPEDELLVPPPPPSVAAAPPERQEKRRRRR